MHTEASHRFERGVDPEGTRYAMDRAVALWEEMGEAQVAPGVRRRVSGGAQAASMSRSGMPASSAPWGVNLPPDRDLRYHRIPGNRAETLFRAGTRGVTAFFSFRPHPRSGHRGGTGADPRLRQHSGHAAGGADGRRPGRPAVALDAEDPFTARHRGAERAGDPALLLSNDEPDLSRTLGRRRQTREGHQPVAPGNGRNAPEPAARVDREPARPRRTPAARAP